MNRTLFCTAMVALTVVSHAWADQSVLLPTADEQAVTWRYTTSKPGDRWEQVEYDDSEWEQGRTGFGTHGTPSSVIGTIWDTKDVWIRTTFDYDGDAFEKAVLRSTSMKIRSSTSTARRSPAVGLHYRLRPSGRD